MSSELPNKELSGLLEDLIRQTITPQQHDRLQNLLRDDPAAQDEYLRHIDLEVGLQRHLSADPILGTSLDFRTAPEPVVVNPNLPSRWPPAARISVLLATLVATILLNLNVSPIIKQINHSGVSGSPALRSTDLKHATVVQFSDAKLFGETLPKLGEPLKYNHQYALAEGMMQLHFPSGAEVILEAPSVVQIATPDRLIVDAGHCSVYAPDGAEGFEVITPHSKVVDLGTRFSVSVSEGVGTDVQVVEGAAEVWPTSPSGEGASIVAPLTLTKQQSRRIRNESEHELRFEPEQYVKNLPDQIIRYEASHATHGEGVDGLTSVVVQRGGQRITYPAIELIPTEVVYFQGVGSNGSIVAGHDFQGDDSGLLRSDRSLTTGMIDFGGNVRPLTKNPLESDSGKPTPGMAVRFQRPVVNGPGPDVLLFEFQSLIDPLDGDGFHVSPLRFDGDLKSITIDKYDITLNSPEALPLAPFDYWFYPGVDKSLRDLRKLGAERLSTSLHYYALAVGIDLSDLGYESGSEVTGLFFQDDMADANIVDPVFIGGLPSLENSFLQEDDES